MANGATTNSMEKVSTFGPITQAIMVNGLKVKCMDLVLSNGQMVVDIWDNSKMILKMDMGLSI